jgi:hypothetical protein
MNNIFKTIDEILPLVPQFTNGINFAAVINTINDAADEYVVPYLSQDQLDELLEAYHSEAAMEEKPAALLALVQSAAANFAYPTIRKATAVKTSAAGTHKVENNSGTTTFKYQNIEADNTAMRTGYRALSRMLKYLNANVDDFTEWASSAENTTLQSLLLNDIATFQKYISIHDNYLLFYRLAPIIARLESSEIQNLLGATLYADFKEKYAARNTTPLTAAYKVLLQYTQGILSYLAIEQGIIELHLTYNIQGYYTLRGIGDQAADHEASTPDMLNTLKVLYQKQTTSLISNLLGLLNKEAADNYPLFVNSAFYKNPDVTYTPINSAQSNTFTF